MASPSFHMPGIVPSGFDSFPDYSRINEGRHNVTRQNTFHTPGKLKGVKSPTSSSRVGTPMTLPTSNIDARNVLDVCELTFAKNLRDLHSVMMTDFRIAMQEAMEPLRSELAATVADSRAASALEQIRDRLNNFEAPKLEIDPFIAETRNVLNRYEELSRPTQESLVQELRDLREEFSASRRQGEDALQRIEAEVGSLHNTVENAQSRMQKFIERQEGLHKTVECMTLDLREMRDRTEESGDFADKVEEHIVRILTERPVNVDFAKVYGCIGKSSEAISHDLTFLLQEIGKIQQALNVDFVSVLDLRLGEMSKGLTESVQRRHTHITDKPGSFTSHHSSFGFAARIRRRLRDCSTQAEANPIDAACQTDPVHFADKEKKSKEKAPPEKPPPAEKAKPKKAAGVFGDAEQMKAKARLALMKPQYDVRDYYHRTGVIQRIARHWLFDNVTLGVIIANAIWMAIDADLNTAEVLYLADPIFQIVENLFCTYFFVELVIRFLAFKSKCRCLRDFWFVFDSLLVFLMVMETWVVTIYLASTGGTATTMLGNSTILRVARVVKMLRISRMARLLRSVPELVILLKGVKAASRSVAVFVFLWTILVFVYALVFRQLSDSSSAIFGSMPEAMNTLVLHGVVPNYSYLVDSSASENWIFWPVTMTFVLLTGLVLMNMLVGVLVEVIGAIAAAEKEGIAVMRVSGDMRVIFEEMGLDPNNHLTQEEFMKVVVHPELVSLVESVGVEVVPLMEMAVNIFEDLHKAGEVGMTFQQMVEVILNMRGSNPVKVKDMKEQLRTVMTVLKDVQKSNDAWMDKLELEMTTIKEHLREIGQSHRQMDGTIEEDEEDES